MTAEPGQPSDPVTALRQIVFALEAAAEPGYRVRAFQRAAEALAALPAEDVRRLALKGQLKSVPGVGESVERAVMEALAGEAPELSAEDPAADRRHPLGRRQGGSERPARRLPHAFRLERRPRADRDDGGGGDSAGARVHGADGPLAATDDRQRAVGGACWTSS